MQLQMLKHVSDIRQINPILIPLADFDSAGLLDLATRTSNLPRTRSKTLMMCSRVAFFSCAVPSFSPAHWRKNLALLRSPMTSRKTLIGAKGMPSGLAWSTILNANTSSSRQCITTSMSMPALEASFCVLLCERGVDDKPPALLVAIVMCSGVCFSLFVNYAWPSL
jgi:hypothetical protein